MSVLDQLKPAKAELVINLVREAGVDIADWSNFKRGKQHAASNPKYCYAWSFVEPEKLVVLNLWHSDLYKSDTGQIIHEINFKERGKNQIKPIWRTRDLKLDNAIQMAYEQTLPIRVIILDGEKRKVGAPIASKVKKRALDSIEWHIAKYDYQTGACKLVRGPSDFVRYVDQFSLSAKQSAESHRVAITSYAYTRDSKVRAAVRLRAQGKCELCGCLGFAMPDGSIYLETHHVISLADGGTDDTSNVVALCPNDHRAAHYSKEKAEILQKLKTFLETSK